MCAASQHILLVFRDAYACYTEYIIAECGTVVNVLCYKSEGRWFDSRWCHWSFSISLSYYGPGVDSASNRNEYQENFLGVNAAGAYG